MPHDIFISYSRHDLATVKPIKEELEAQGFSCWMDLEGIESGSPEFTEKIAEAIGGAAAVLFFISNDSQKSRWSLNELRLARDEGRHVVIVRFDETKMFPVFKLEFGGADIIDWRSPVQKGKLLCDLKKWSHQQEPCYLTVSATLDGRDVQGAKLSVDGLTMDLPDTMILSYGTDVGPLDASFFKDGVQFTSRTDRFPVNWHGKMTLVMPLKRR